MPDERRGQQDRRQRLEEVELERRSWNEDHPMARLEVLREKIRRLEDDVRDSRDDQVSKQEFEPVKRLIYGLVSVILLAVITAILALVLSGKMP